MSKTTPAQRQNDVIAAFRPLESWEDRYKKIIEWGKALPDLPDSLRSEEAKVKGCQSQVWLHSSLTPEGRMELKGDSDAMIVKGLVAILLRIYSDSTPAEVLATPPDFLQELGFAGNLSPSRANGLHSMIKQIRMFATAYGVMLARAGKS